MPLLVQCAWFWFLATITTNKNKALLDIFFSWIYWEAFGGQGGRGGHGKIAQAIEWSCGLP